MLLHLDTVSVIFGGQSRTSNFTVAGGTGVAEVVGATSSEGFLVTLDVGYLL